MSSWIRRSGKQSLRFWLVVLAVANLGLMVASTPAPAVEMPVLGNKNCVSCPDGSCRLCVTSSHQGCTSDESCTPE